MGIVCYSTYTIQYTVTHAGHVRFVYIRMHPAFFCVTVVTHVTVRDVLVTRRGNSTIMRHLSYKSTSFTRTSVSIHIETSEHGLKEVTAVIFRDSFKRIMTFLQDVTRLSCDNGCRLGKQQVGMQNCLPDIL